MVNFDTIRVHKDDKKKLIIECKALFIKEHPELKGYPFSQNFLFKKVIEYYLNS